VNYKLVEIEVLNEDFIDIFVAELSAIEFEGFEESSQKVIAYIPENLLDLDDLRDVIHKYSKMAKAKLVSVKDLEDKNWNELWESNFKAVCIDDKIIVKAPFHKTNKVYPFTITIEPKMSFGTGHHETTALVLGQMLEIDFTDKSVFDYGSGTGILSIMASKLNAKEIFAIDIDNWAYVNSKENFELNKVGNVVVKKGTIVEAANKKFEIVLANINRNVILETFDALVACLSDSAKVLFSGLLSEDFEIVNEMATKHKMKLFSKKEHNNWIVLHYDRVV